MKVGIITCWYKDLSMADYADNLRRSFDNRVDFQIITAPCVCWRRFVGKRNVFQGNCSHSSFPPYLATLESNVAPAILKPLIFFILLCLQFLRGVDYLSKCKRCDVIHYQQSSMFQFGMIPLLALLLIPTSKKRVVTIHWLQALGRLAFLYRSYNNADKIIVHSADMKKQIQSFGVPDSKIAIIPHGTALPVLLHLPRNEITFFGAPTEGKGFFTILESLKILREQGRKLKLNVYGIYSEEEKNKAMANALGNGVDDLVVWGGRLSKTDFDRKMQGSTFTLAPYSAYVSGSSIVTSAMGNGTPIIASRIGGIPEYLGEAGLLIEPNEPSLLAAAMIKLIDDPSLRGRLSEQGRKRAERFSWKGVGEMTLKVYYECLKKG